MTSCATRISGKWWCSVMPAVTSWQAVRGLGTNGSESGRRSPLRLLQAAAGASETSSTTLHHLSHPLGGTGWDEDEEDAEEEFTWCFLAWRKKGKEKQEKQLEPVAHTLTARPAVGRARELRGDVLTIGSAASIWLGRNIDICSRSWLLGRLAGNASTGCLKSNHKALYSLKYIPYYGVLGSLRTSILLSRWVHKPQKVYTFSFIVGNNIPKRVKCIHSTTKLS